MSETEQAPPKRRGRPRKYPYPSRLTCTVTGRSILTNPTQFKKQLDESGKSMEDYISTYVCRTARLKLEKGLAVLPLTPIVKKEAPVVAPKEVVSVPKSWGDDDRSVPKSWGDDDRPEELTASAPKSWGDEDRPEELTSVVITAAKTSNRPYGFAEKKATYKWGGTDDDS
jgi:hypothetical protein